MASKRKHYEVTLKIKYNALKDDDQVSPPSQFEIEDAIETLKILTLFETDPKFDTILSQKSVKINHRRLVNRRQTKK